MAVHLSDNSANITLAAGTLPAVIFDGSADFSIVFWFWHEADANTSSHIMRCGSAGNFEISVRHISEANTLRCRLHRGLDSNNVNVNCDFGGDLADGEWIVGIVSFDVSSSTLAVYARSESLNPSRVQDVDSFVNGGIDSYSGDWGFGDPYEGDTQPGVLMSWSLRTGEVLGWDDLDDIWASKRIDAPLNFPLSDGDSDYSETATANLGGVANLHRAAFYGTATRSGSEDVGLGDSIPTGAIDALEYFASGGDLLDTETMTVAGTITWVDPLDAAFGPYHEQQGPQRSSGPSATRVSASLPMLRQLAIDSPSEIVNVGVAGNSRVAGKNVADGRPEHFADGLQTIRSSSLTGVLCQPPLINSNNGERYGYNCGANGPYTDGGAGLADEGDNYNRFGINYWGESGSTVGSGRVIRIPAGGTYTARCEPSFGAIADASEAITTAYYLLKVPGAADLDWQPNHNTQQGGAGTDIETESTETMATSSTSHTVASAPTADSITISGDVTAQFTAGKAVTHDGTAGEGRVNVVAGSSFSTGTTTVTFAHDWDVAPTATDTVYVGDWSFVEISHAFSGSEGNWRGIRLTGDSGGGYDCILVAKSAVQPSTPGFRIGQFGKSGKGYDEQLAEQFSGALAALAQAVGFDVMIQTDGYQSSDPDSFGSFLDELQTTLPSLEALWLTGMAHGVASSGADLDSAGNSTFDAWNNWIMDNASAAGAAAVNITQDMGTWMEQLGRLRRADNLHAARAGNEAYMTLAMSAAASASTVVVGSAAGSSAACQTVLMAAAITGGVG